MSAADGGGQGTGVAPGGAAVSAAPAGAAVAERPRLHLPDEPVARRKAWWAAVLDDTPYDDVLVGDDGIAAWLWSRWAVLGPAGVDRDALAAVVAGYRRELWLWLAGDRTWAQCCSGLMGRIERRFPG